MSKIVLDFKLNEFELEKSIKKQLKRKRTTEVEIKKIIEVLTKKIDVNKHNIKVLNEYLNGKLVLSTCLRKELGKLTTNTKMLGICINHLSDFEVKKYVPDIEESSALTKHTNNAKEFLGSNGFIDPEEVW